MITLYPEELSTIIIIHANGALTMESLKEAEEIWNEQLEKRPAILAFDFRDITDIDSIAMNHLFKLAKTAGAKDVKIIICDSNEHLDKLFDVIKLGRVIGIMSKQKFYEEYVNRM